MLSTIIIDDQKICTELVKDVFSSNCPDVKVAATCHSGKAGIIAIKKHKPDLVILDVEMPGMNGFEMLSQIKDPSFYIIFTTSHDRFVLDAIRLSAIDYLLKPILPNELTEAVNRVVRKKNDNHKKKLNFLFNYLEENKRTLRRVALPMGDSLLFFDVNDIIHCESDSNYTSLFMSSGQKLLVTRTLKDVETMLEGNDFFRIHHSHLVNMSQIVKYVKGNAGYVIMSDKMRISVARNRKEDFLERFAHL